jgi:hypothetical protein
MDYYGTPINLSRLDLLRSRSNDIKINPIAAAAVDAKDHPAINLPRLDLLRERWNDIKTDIV